MKSRFLILLAALSAILSSVSGVQSTTPSSASAKDVIAKWRSAVHAPAPAVSLEATLETTSNEEGVDAEIREWITASDNYHSVINRPFDTMEYLVSKGIGSLRDWNGYICPVAGNRLRWLEDKLFELRTILFGPSQSLQATVIDSGAQTPLILCSVQPSGDTLQWYIDRTTGRPIKSVRAGEDSQITTTYDDWREMSGVLMPRRGSVEETDKPSFTWERKSVEFVEGSSGSDFKPLKPGPSDTYFTGTVEPIPFTFENDHIIFKLSVNKGKPMWWLLDTGADVNVVNQVYLADFGLETYGKTTATGGGGAADYSYARGATFELPGVELRNQHVSILDQSGIERAYGMIMGGILGYDFISRFVMEIDYEKKLVTLYDPAKWEYKGSGVVVPITIDYGIPHADAIISVPGKDAVPANIIIDFGAAETMTLTSPFVKANNLVSLAGTNASVNKMSGLENQWFSQSNVRGRISRLVMGGLVVDSFPANFSVNTKGAYASTSFSGTVGEGIYHRYHTFLDYTRNRIIFEPTAEASKPFPERRTYGITLLASGADYHTYTVTGVRAGSPAENDGFQKGDIIAGLDSLSSSQFTLGELRVQIAQDGRHHDFKIIRGDSTFTKSVEIRRVSIEQK
jgi:hypothetical protein